MVKFYAKGMSPDTDIQIVDISSVRGGNIFGEHVVIFANEKDG